LSSLSIATATEVFDLVRDDLAAIEREFARQSASDVEVVTDIARYLIAGGGKRIRPLLLLLSAKALDCQTHSRIRLGAVVEMLHTATLVHDDIIDEASTRRGRPSSNTTWGNAKCVLAGDWIATGWPSTMESAARSGHLAAETVCAAIGEWRKILDPDLKPRGLMRFVTTATSR